MDDLDTSPGERMRSALKPYHIITKILVLIGALYLATSVVSFFIRINSPYPLQQEQLLQLTSTTVSDVAYAAELIGFAAIVEFLRRIYQELRARKL